MSESRRVLPARSSAADVALVAELTVVDATDFR
jgi:hypothetical protein